MYTDFIGHIGMGRDYTFRRPLINGLPTKATRILMDIYVYEKFLGQNFTRKELLRRVNVPQWKERSTCMNFYNSAKSQGFIKRKNGKVYVGENLEDYLKLHNLI